MDQSIKRKVRSNLINQQLEAKAECIVCSEITLQTINFKDENSTCRACNNQVPISEGTYENIYKELNKIGIR